MDPLESIRDFAKKAHKGQKRKYSKEKFIRHPERVMNICREYTSDISILAAALLHDVIEDTAVTVHELKEFLYRTLTTSEAEKTLGLVVELTDIYTDENFPHLNRKQRKTKEGKRLQLAHPDAQTIKYADVLDNAIDVVENDIDFARVFIKECQDLLLNMPRGHSELFKRAEQTINECALKVKK